MKKISTLSAGLVGIILFCLSFQHAKAGNDVHRCWDVQGNIVEEFGPESRSFYWFPRCLTGGYWQNVQCDIHGCYCAYVDTGLMIPNTIQNALRQYMEKNCPMLSSEMPDACSLPPPDYPCKETSKRYYYDHERGNCVPSIHSCLGFKSLAGCRKACEIQTRDRCNFRENKGRKCDRRKPQQRWYHDEETGNCRIFRYEGCGGNANNYREKWMCLKTCEQVQDEELVIQVDRTKYVIRLPTWMVVQQLLVPEANNKITVEQFKDIEGYMVEISRLPAKDPQREGPIEPDEPDFRPEYAEENDTQGEICSLPAATGPCRAFIRRWYFDERKSKCVRFIYGGCYPNANNFKTPSRCARFCDAKIKPTELEIIEGMIASGEPGPEASKPEKPDGARGLSTDGDSIVIGSEDIDFEFGGSSS